MAVRPLEPAELACDLSGRGFILGELMLDDDACYGGGA
jgi:hypothetical protein